MWMMPVMTMMAAMMVIDTVAHAIFIVGLPPRRFAERGGTTAHTIIIVYGPVSKSISWKPVPSKSTQ